MLAILAGGWLLVGCGQPPATPVVAAGQTLDPAVAARDAMARRDWVAAAPLLRRAIPRDPENLSLHYSLAICASHLDLRNEAIREFRWVLAHAPANSDESQIARHWLVEAGMLPSLGLASTDQQRVVDSDAVGNSSLAGFVTWAEADGHPAPAPRIQLHLIGLPDTPTKNLRYTVRADEGGGYEFAHVVAGPYKLTNVIAGPAKWRLRVSLEPGSAPELDLTPENSVERRDDFAGDG